MTALVRQRDAHLELDFLDRSARQARFTAAQWPSVVQARLQEGEYLYGDRWTTYSCARLLREVEDEFIDAAAWACLALQTLGPDQLPQWDPINDRSIPRKNAGDFLVATTASAAAAYVEIQRVAAHLKNST